MFFGFQNIRINYEKKQILSSLNFEVPQGKIVTLIGQNGCGKSSLLKTVSRAVIPQSGEVIFRDKKVKQYASKELAQKIAYLAQVHTSPPDINVRTLVSYGRYPYSRFGRGLTQKDMEIVEHAIAMTGLTGLQDQMLSTLSGGERQRAWIAMTVAQEPELLILDEPTTYLDISYQIEVLELVKELNQKLGMTILMVLHDLNLAARYSDYLCVVKNGKVYAMGSPEEIITRENLRIIFEIDAVIQEDVSNACPYFIPLRRT